MVATSIAGPSPRSWVSCPETSLVSYLNTPVQILYSKKHTLDVLDLLSWNMAILEKQRKSDGKMN